MSGADLQLLRVHAVSHSLFEPTNLKRAIQQLAFIQADPIRSPARAQDLILRHRVKGYCAGDLERHYPSLDIEEDILYAYGFLPRSVYQLLHPRSANKLSKLEKCVFETVCGLGVGHPKELATRLGRNRVVNAWGGHSTETTEALDHLHYRGHLRVARREKGIRIYEPSKMPIEPMPPEERLKSLVKVITNLLGPIPERSLQAAMASIRRSFPKLNTRTAVANLVGTGELIRQSVDGIHYIYLNTPARTNPKEALRHVRILTPFDPLVWDRQRFEHFWGWKYRFEAYTPPAKRVRGYYAMPLLWIDRIIGWANIGVIKERLDVEIGFNEKRPKEKDFRLELEIEIGRIEAFLKTGKETKNEQSIVRFKPPLIGSSG